MLGQGLFLESFMERFHCSMYLLAKAQMSSQPFRVDGMSGLLSMM